MVVTITATPGIILSFRVTTKDVSSLDKRLNRSRTIEGEVEKREEKLVVEKSRSFSTLVSLRFEVTRELGVVN